MISPELEVSFWHQNKFLDSQADCLPSLIPISLVQSQACCVTISTDIGLEDAVASTRQVWATVGLTCVYFHHSAYEILLIHLQDVMVI